LEQMPAQSRRKRVTLVWNRQDVTRVLDSIQDPGIQYKAIEFPIADYGFPQRDEVRSPDGRFIGLSGLCGYSINEARMLSLGMLNADEAVEGKEVVITWGEAEGGSRKPRVERHRQTAIRATVGPAPYAQPVREMKRGG
jgi:vanillate/3-O-methylgallate O-demethylase